MNQITDPSWLDDLAHPIPYIHALDVMGKYEDGRRELAIVIAAPLDDSPYTQNRLLNKIQDYLHFLSSEQYASEFGPPSPTQVQLVVRIHPGSAPLLFELLERCADWVRKGVTTLVVQRQ